MTEKSNTKSILEYIGKMQTIGGTIANAFINADVKADSTKRELLLECAKTHADKAESVKYILEGFASKFEALGYNANVIKQRKAEANAVFKCVSLTTITNDHLHALTKFEGGYHAFINEARALTKAHAEANKPADAPATDQQPPKVRPLTDIQLQNVKDSLKKANSTELVTIADNVIVELNRVAQSPELAQLSQFNLIANIANSIASNESFDKVSQDVALEVFKLVNVHINKLEAVQKTTAATLADVMKVPAMM